jgi:hypothetical protein
VASEVPTKAITYAVLAAIGGLASCLASVLDQPTGSVTMITDWVPLNLRCGELEPRERFCTRCHDLPTRLRNRSASTILRRRACLDRTQRGAFEGSRRHDRDDCARPSSLRRLDSCRVTPRRYRPSPGRLDSAVAACASTDLRSSGRNLELSTVDSLRWLSRWRNYLVHDDAQAREGPGQYVAPGSEA